MNASTGTLIWIGPRTSAETRDAVEYCQRHASQVALRDSLLDAVTRPADAVRGIVVSRQARQSVDESHLAAIAERYPDARRTVLIGSNAEGEGRTGFAWPTLVVAATQQHAEALLDTLDQWSVAALWQSQPSPATARHVHRVIWDDSAAPATTATGWQQRLQTVHLAPEARHAWTVHYPRADQLASARRGGIDVSLSKPYLHASLLRFLSPAPLPS